MQLKISLSYPLFRRLHTYSIISLACNTHFTPFTKITLMLVRMSMLLNLKDQNYNDQKYALYLKLKCGLSCVRNKNTFFGYNLLR
jgi:hypothetical protein